MKKKVVLITGASRGIGRATAILASKKGFKVGINYINNKVLAEKTLIDIKNIGGDAILLKGDISKEKDVDSIFSKLELKFGKVNYLVANAGLIPKRKEFHETSFNQIKKSININFTGVIYCVHRFVNSSQNAHKERSIVLLSSEAARFGGNKISTYAACKSAINTFAVGMARELGPMGIRINCVSPGTILTDGLKSEGKTVLESIKQTIPLGRIGSPNEAAETIIWLLSNKSSFVSGSTITVSGGR